jgi:VanZ family protein
MPKSRILLLTWYVMLALVTTLSLLPGELVPAPPVGDKATHYFAYFALALVPMLALASGRRLLQAALFPAALGFALELMQTLVPGRAFEWRDVAANTVGVATGTLIGWLLRLGKPVGDTT